MIDNIFLSKYGQTVRQQTCIVLLILFYFLLCNSSDSGQRQTGLDFGCIEFYHHNSVEVQAGSKNHHSTQQAIKLSHNVTPESVVFQDQSLCLLLWFYHRQQ